MSEFLERLLGPDAVQAAGLIVGASGALGTVRLYLRHRGRLELERERSRRARFRALALAKTVTLLRPGSRVLERDPDGGVCLVDCSGVAEAAAPARVSGEAA